jgi:hypothetical protein
LQRGGPCSRCLTTLGIIVLLAACGGHSGGSGAAASQTYCGKTHTAASVPVRIKVVRGSVSCATAMAIERGYASAVAAGQAPGNGGGGPVKVSGWTCRGFTTPIVLRTGNVSRCVKGGSEILAVLPPVSV